MDTANQEENKAVGKGSKTATLTCHRVSLTCSEDTHAVAALVEAQVSKLHGRMCVERAANT